MIRRGFWLAAGAVLGVAGYRRVTRLGRWLASDAPPAPAQTAPSGQPARTPGPVEGTLGPVERTLGPVAAAGHGHQAARRPTSTAARILAVMSFIRDVRRGMAEYSDLHRRELARTLGSRSDRISSG